MQARFEHMVQCVPFVNAELHPDYGAEFFNAHLVRFWNERVVGFSSVAVVPLRKTTIASWNRRTILESRQYFGDLRIDLALATGSDECALRADVGLPQFFQPEMHLMKKRAVGEWVRREWDKAKTPFERVKALDKLSPEQQKPL